MTTKKLVTKKNWRHKIWDAADYTNQFLGLNVEHFVVDFHGPFHVLQVDTHLVHFGMNLIHVRPQGARHSL